jgi:hypothetical protein
MRDLEGGCDLDLARRGGLGPGIGHELVARDVGLDVVDAIAAAKPDRAPGFVRPVGDHAQAFGMDVLLCALVAQTSGCCDLGASGAIARSGEIAVSDFLLHDDVEAKAWPTPPNSRT